MCFVKDEKENWIWKHESVDENKLTIKIYISTAIFQYSSKKLS